MAFPSKEIDFTESAIQGRTVYYHKQLGMTLIDYFSGKAMQGLISNSDTMRELTQAWKKSGIKDEYVYFERFAEVAYSYAKGMLKERQKHLK